MKTVLAADIGGTKSRFYLAELRPQGAHKLHQACYFNRDFPDFTAVMRQFLATANYQHITAACFAIAGPVIGQSVQMTNLPWHLDANVLAKQFNIGQVQIINDFAAQVSGLDQLNESDLYCLQSGTVNLHGPRAMIGAGTGLGAALGIYSTSNQQWQYWPSQGGNAAFAPINDEQISLWQFLRQQRSHISNETVLSGAGIQRLFHFVLQQNANHKNNDLQNWPAAQITASAIEKTHPAAETAMQLFVNIYGAAAGNLALTTLPSGGLFITGGIAPKILPLMKTNNFMHGFFSNPHMQDILKTIPVYIVLNEQIGIFGAKYCAIQIANSMSDSSE